MSRVSNAKTCRCHACAKDFHPLGITRHRAMHRDRGELVRITYTYGDTYIHDFRPAREKFDQPTEVGW